MRRGGVQPGNRWMISSNNRPSDKRDDREFSGSSSRAIIDQESYVVEGLLSKGKEIAINPKEQKNAGSLNRLSRRVFKVQTNMDVDDVDPKNLQAAVLSRKHCQ
ncbi:unnamed protein product [Cuscuta epithymum]|uniref:Uncharacterized protein n=1 Tax=Cuscuta epithymum TaxID=186058 RepID=A0AAV0F483_9ASTE|nr:unnamed protein product [Cuscuta epithymum]